MTNTEAREIARQYAWNMEDILSGFRFGVDNEEEFTRCYYFDFIWLTSDGKTPEDAPITGGARGLTVSKHDKQVKVMSYGAYWALKEEENKLTETYQLLLDCKHGRMPLTEIKAKFGLKSAQVLELSRVLKDTELNKEGVYELLAKFITN